MTSGEVKLLLFFFSTKCFLGGLKSGSAWQVPKRSDSQLCLLSEDLELNYWWLKGGVTLVLFRQLTIFSRQFSNTVSLSLKKFPSRVIGGNVFTRKKRQFAQKWQEIRKLWKKKNDGKLLMWDYRKNLLLYLVVKIVVRTWFVCLSSLPA